MASLVNRLPESSTGGNDCRPEPLSEDADVLQELLAGNKTVFYDIWRRLFMFGVKKPGH